MDVWVQTAILLLGQLVVAAFVYGKLTQRQKDQGGWLRAHEEKLDKHDDRLVEHESRLSRIEGRKNYPLGGH